MFKHYNEFSLIELIVVVAVLGLLASIVIPNINDMQQKAYVVHVKGNVRDIQTAVDMYRIDHGSYPVGVQPTPSSPQFIDFNLMYPDYVKNLPKYNERYWVDFLGTVWGSHTDIPTMKGQGTSIVSWEAVPGVESYAVYEVVNKNGQTATSLIGSIAGSAGGWHFESLTNYSRRELFEVKAFPESKIIQFIGDANKQYIVAAQDDMGFYTAPGGDELDTPISLEDGEFERTMYVNTAAPSMADWLSVSDKKIVPEGSSITYQFAYSKDKGKTLSDWYDNIEDVPDATYLRVKIVLVGTETARPILQQLKINYKLQGSEAESCTVNLYQEDQDCKMEQSKEPVTSEKIPVDKVIPPKGEITIPIPSGDPVTSVTPSYSGSGNPDISYSDGSNSFDHPLQGNPTDIIIKNPSDKPLDVSDITINRTEKPPTVQTAQPNGGSSNGSGNTGGNNGSGGSNGTDKPEAPQTPEEPEIPEVQEAWKEVDRFTLIEDAGEVVTWTKVEFSQNKPNTDTSRLRVEIDGTKLEDYKSGTSIGKSSQELRVNFIGEVEGTSNLTWKDVPYPETITVYFTTKDGANKHKEYAISKDSSGKVTQTLLRERVEVDRFTFTENASEEVTWDRIEFTQNKANGDTYGLRVSIDGTKVEDYKSGSSISTTSKEIKVNFIGEAEKNSNLTWKDVPYPATITVYFTTKDGVKKLRDYAISKDSFGKVTQTLLMERVIDSKFSSVKFKQISAGEQYNLALTEDGEVYAWGLNDSGQLGNGTNINSPLPILIDGLPKIKHIGAGSTYSLAVTEDGQIYAWGSNKYGELGLGSKTSFYTPQLVEGISNVKQVESGYWLSVALTESGDVYAWGYNCNGQLGYDATGDVLTPKKIPTLSNIKQINTTFNGAYALTESGDVYAWGNNYKGGLALGSGLVSNIIAYPTKIPTLSNIKEISARMALTEDGKVYTWGANTDGSVGDGTVAIRYEPYLVPSLPKIKTIASDSWQSIAISENGETYMWGATGSGGRKDKPVLYPNLSNAKMAGAGLSRSMILTEDNRLYVFGVNKTGSIGNGTLVTSSIPIQINK